MDCILLAGGRPKVGEALYEVTRGAPKAIAVVAGRPMIDWVLRSLRASNEIDRIIVIGLRRERERLDSEASAELRRVETEWSSRDVVFGVDHGSFAANLYAGIDLCRAERVLYCGSDIPLLRTADVDRFVDRSAESPASDVVAGLVPRQSIEARYPGADDLWLRLREGEFIVADMAVFDPVAAPSVRSHLEALAPQRKSAWRQARYVGLGLLARYATRRLTVPHFERHLRDRFGLRCRLRVDCEAELGLDVDSLGALRLCESALAARG
jgi:GTP:adenosylcobinamide-phosphate guanylyltransferase